MRTQILLFLLFLFSQTAQTQQGTFFKLIGNGFGRNILIDNNEDYLISGNWRADPRQTDWQLMLLKVTSSGDSVFQKIFPNAPREYSQSGEILQTKGGSYLVSSNIVTTPPFGNLLLDIAMAKFGQSGDSTFIRRYNINQENIENIYSMNCPDDSSLLLVGLNGDSGLFLKLDTNGNVIRVKTFPNLRFSTILKYNSETIFIFGYKDSTVGSSQFRKLMILKTTMNGDSLGTILMTPSHRDAFLGRVIKMADGNFAFRATYVDSFNIEKRVLRKCDSQGRMIWEWSIPDDNRTGGALAPTPDSGIVLLRYFSFSPQQIRLCKINNSGAVAWQRDIQLPSYIESGQYNSIVVTKEGYILLSGYIQTLWEEKVFLLKTTSEGYVNVGVEDEAEYQPQRFSLEQNYPNPFNPVTSIRYTTSSPTLLLQKSTGSFGEKGGASPSLYQGEGFRVRLSVYDILGREVATLVDEEKAAGAYTVTFNAAQLASGTYFYELRAGGFREVKKMVLLK